MFNQNGINSSLFTNNYLIAFVVKNESNQQYFDKSGHSWSLLRIGVF